MRKKIFDKIIDALKEDDLRSLQKIDVDRLLSKFWDNLISCLPLLKDRNIKEYLIQITKREQYFKEEYGNMVHVVSLYDLEVNYDEIISFFKKCNVKFKKLNTHKIKEYEGYLCHADNKKEYLNFVSKIYKLNYYNWFMFYYLKFAVCDDPDSHYDIQGSMNRYKLDLPSKFVNPSNSKEYTLLEMMYENGKTDILFSLFYSYDHDIFCETFVNSSYINNSVVIVLFRELLSQIDLNIELQHQDITRVIVDKINHMINKNDNFFHSESLSINDTRGFYSDFKYMSSESVVYLLNNLSNKSVNFLYSILNKSKDDIENIFNKEQQEILLTRLL